MSVSQGAPPDEAAVVEAIRGGDQVAFAAAVEAYRPQLRVHCYRMLGSFDDADDLVQETLLRAWRARASFEGRSLVRTWLYRIATNACLNALQRRPRRVLPQDVAAPVTAETDASEARSQPSWAPEVPWLQPYPDALLEPAAPADAEPEARLIARESIELVFLAALQHLPPRQRAVLLLRDALDWSARETADLLDTSVASVNSAHQRARATLRTNQPAPRREQTPSSNAERATLQRFMQAWERADAQLLTSLLREDARWAMPPARLWFDGRAAILRLFDLFPIDWNGRVFRLVPTAANRQPAAACYVRWPGESAFNLSALHVLRVEHDQIAEVTTFGPELCRAFEFPPSLPVDR
jgi:RNA polymerase sigma-70 factor, ECF subfamily